MMCDPLGVPDALHTEKDPRAFFDIAAATGASFTGITALAIRLRPRHVSVARWMRASSASGGVARTAAPAEKNNLLFGYRIGKLPL